MVCWKSGGSKKSVKKSMKSLDQYDQGSVRIQVSIKICLTLGLFFGAESRGNTLRAESPSIFLV